MTKLHELPVDQLKFGMYIAQLDRPWSETPFAFQGFVLRTEQQLEALKKYCRRVYVDPGKQQYVEPPKTVLPPGPEDERARKPAGADEKVRGTTVYRELASFEDELPRARAAFRRTGAVVELIARSVSATAVLDGARAREAVHEIAESVVRNPDAMMLLATMRERSAEALDRAVQVSVYMTVFGRFLQLAREQLELLGLLGLLQDVGFLKLPPGLAARRSDLTREEEEVFRQHVRHGLETLSNTPGLPAELPALASLHHERYDGSGYPRGLRGNAIAQAGAIAAIVDTFDMLTAPRPYGAQLPASNALSVLYQNRGTQFHAALIEQFIQCVGAFPVGSVVELNTGEVGIVLTQNFARRLQPRVMVVQDAQGHPVVPHKVLDLMKEPMASADEPYRIRRTLDATRVRVNLRDLFL